MLSIIIITYNSEKYIENCLNSVYENISDQDEVFVIDNNSHDESVNIVNNLKKNNLFLIKNSENLGFAKAVNQCLFQEKGDYIFLINPDTEFNEDVLEHLIILANKNNKLGIAGVCQKNNYNKFISSWGNFPSKFSKIIRKLKLYKFLAIGDWIEYNYLNKNLFITNRKVDWVSGGFMLIKREVINKVGLFDENFFMYYEDVDYCKRATDAGFEVWYFGKIQVMHFAGASSNRRKNYIDSLSRKSLDYYLKKHNLTKN